MSNYTLQKLTQHRLEEISEAWSRVAGEDEFQVEMSVLFRWAADHCDRSDDGYVLELRTDNGEAAAILEVVEGRQGALTKLLKLYASPLYWQFTSITQRTELIDMYAAAYAQLITLGINNGSEDVKIYGRTDLMLSILKSLHGIWPAEETGTQAVIEGRWLRIQKLVLGAGADERESDRTY